MYQGEKEKAFQVSGWLLRGLVGCFFQIKHWCIVPAAVAQGGNRSQCCPATGRDNPSQGRSTGLQTGGKHIPVLWVDPRGVFEFGSGPQHLQRAAVTAVVICLLVFLFQTP